MSCHYRNNDSDTLLTCMSLTPLFSAADVQNFASRAGADSGYVYNFVVACLRVNRQIRPNIPEGPCSSLAPNAGGITEIGEAQQAASAVGGALAPFTGGLSAFASGLFDSFLGFFKGLTGAPSTRELQTDCAVTSAWNSFADKAEAGLAGGALPLQDALVNLKLVYQRIDSALSSLEGYTRTDWAPYFHRKANDALYIFNKEAVYPSIAAQQSSGSGKTALIVGGGVVAAKLLGVF